MEVLQRFGALSRMKEPTSQGICEVCGGELDVDPESGQSHCPVCENPEQ